MATAVPDRRTRAPRLAAVLVLALSLAVAACSEVDGGDSGPATTEAPATDAGASPDGFPDGVRVLGPDEDLYALAEDLDPGEPGDPIAVQPVDTGLDATVWRVLHHSRSLEGDGIAVSGIIAVPHGPAPEGGRPVASWAHGTTGLADDCAPSRTLSQLEAAIPMLARGMVVAATDYEGLGTPGLHPYLVGESQGRGVLDVVRAARALGPEVGAGSEVIVWGHSQGGHAALFANQIASDWAPELDVLGVVAGAPPSQMPLLLAALGRGDVLIPEATSSLLSTRLCSVGQPVRYLAYPDADHISVIAEAMPEMLDWIEARLAGQPAPDDCESQFGEN